jgi:hypothetical protein
MDLHAPIEIKDRPWGLAALLLVFGITSIATLRVTMTDGQYLAALCAAVFFVACLYGAAKAIRFGHVTLRPDGTATFAVRDLRGWRHYEFPAGCLRAGVQNYRDGEGVTGRVMLLIDGEEGVTRIPFTCHFGSSRRAADTVARIMAWRRATTAA